MPAPASLPTATHSLVLEDEAMKALHLALGGKSQTQIAEELGLSRTTVRNRLASARQAYKHRNAEAYELLIADSLSRIEWAQREAALAWGRSIGEHSIRTEKRPALAIEGENFPGPVEVTEKVEMLAGDPRYLDTYLRCEERKAQLLGLDAPKRVEVTIPPEFIPNPERAASEAGMTVEEADRMIKIGLGLAE